MQTLKLFSLNLHGLEEPNPRLSLTTLGDFLLANEYDVIFLQEIVELLEPLATDELWHTGEFLLNYLRTAGCDDYRLSIAHTHEAWGTCNEFVGILTRLPILEQVALRVSQTDDVRDFNRRVLMATTLQVAEQPFQFVSGHFSWSDSEDPFAQQFAAFDDYVKTTKLPTILAGDCNITSFSPDYIDVINRGWTDLYLVKGSDADWTIAEEIDGWEGSGAHGRRIDFCFANTPLRVSAATRHFTGDDRPMISDHVAIALEISL